MDYNSFYEWLLTEQKMGQRSAKDVLSRCKRVCNLLSVDEISEETLSQLTLADKFNNNSIFIKSQLKRAVSLWLEYGGK